MSSKQRMASRSAALGVCGICLFVMIAGCSAQDETVGQGDHELVFSNAGNISVPVTVRWAGGDGRIYREYFTVLVGGKVTVKTIPRLSYDIELDPECHSSASAAQPPTGQDEVIDLRGR